MFERHQRVSPCPNFSNPNAAQHQFAPQQQFAPQPAAPTQAPSKGPRYAAITLLVLAILSLLAFGVAQILGYGAGLLFVDNYDLATMMIAGAGITIFLHFGLSILALIAAIVLAVIGRGKVRTFAFVAIVALLALGVSHVINIMLSAAEVLLYLGPILTLLFCTIELIVVIVAAALAAKHAKATLHSPTPAPTR